MGLDLTGFRAQPFPPTYPTWEHPPASTVQAFSRAYAAWHQPLPGEAANPSLLEELAARTRLGQIHAGPATSPLFTIPGLSFAWTTQGGLDATAATMLLDPGIWASATQGLAMDFPTSGALALYRLGTASQASTFRDAAATYAAQADRPLTHLLPWPRFDQMA